jgi:hypothetical protein
MYEYYVRKVENVVDGDTKVKDFNALKKAREKSGK